MKTPICMAEEFWANSQLSIARHYGRIKVYGHEYWIVDKRGRDLWECSAAADRAGSDKAIPPGEPADLVRKDFIPYYKALGRDWFIEVLTSNQQASEKELIKIFKEITKKPKKAKVKTKDLFEKNG